MPLSNYTLDTFVAQDISKLTACSPQSLASQFPEREHWLSQFILRRVFTNHVAEEQAALAFILLRRTEAAFDEWELACATSSRAHNPSGYFKMLRHLENCISALWQGLSFCRRGLGKDKHFFKKDDGSVYQRLNSLYNVSRHFDPYSLPSGDLHCLWISNDGLHSREHAVTFVELREIIESLADIVQKFAGSTGSVTRDDARKSDKHGS
jgi:hypothetical protein